MSHTELESLRLRLDVLVEVVAALARAMPSDRMNDAQAAVARAVASRLTGVRLSAMADQAVSADVARVLGVAQPAPRAQAG